MKKSIFLAVLGLASGLASSNGQGFVVFSSYVANGGVGATTTLFGSGQLVGIPFQAQLYYVFGTVSDPINQTSFPSIVAPVNSAFTLYTGPNATAAYDNSGDATGGAGLGYFDGYTTVIPGYTGGPITFEVVAFNGSTSEGRSGSFTMDSIANSAVLPASHFGDNGQLMPNFVLWIPEPTSLALTGLGALMSLIMFLRKQS